MFDAVLLTESDTRARLKPLGAYTIAHILREHGLSVLVIDMFSQISQQELHEILDQVVSDRTLFVGYSGSLFMSIDEQGQEHVFPGGVDRFRSTNSYIKTLNAKCQIIFGGSTAKRVVKTIQSSQDNLGLDYVFYGYSDHMIVDFVDRLRAGRIQQCSNKFSGVGLIDYDSRGDVMPFCTNKHRWHDSDIVMPGEALPLEMARGCIFRCKFCAFPLLGKDKNDTTYLRTEESMLAEILENYERWGTTTYNVVDDTVNERSDKLETLLRIRDRSKIDLNFSGFMRLDLIARKAEQLPMLVDLNFRGMYFGIESMHVPSLKVIGKHMPPAETREWLHRVHQAFGGNTLLQAGWIAGLPYETEDTFREWAEWAISDDCPINLNDFNALYLTSNSHNTSEFFREPEKYGYRYAQGVVDSKWENDHWNWSRCVELSREYTIRAFHSGRSRVGAFIAAGITRLGYDFNHVNHVTLKEIVLSGELRNRDALWRQQYFDRLRKYINQGDNNV